MDEENFWQVVEQQVGTVPEHIKCILEFCGFCNIAILDVTDDVLDQIEQEILQMPKIVVPRKSEDFEETVFRSFEPSKFKLLSGDRMLIKIIVYSLKMLDRKDLIKQLTHTKTCQTESDQNSE